MYLCALAADYLAPAGYAMQFRDHPSEPPSAAFLLGTDALGRDLFARTLYGSRISLLLAPAAALIATALGGLLAGFAAFAGGIWETCASRLADLFLSVPWLFLLVTVRAALPLDIDPQYSAAVTFLLLGTLGWAGPARVALAAARSVRGSDFIIQARAMGCGRGAILRAHIVPALRPVLIAQFWTAAPLFILSEASLGFLGLGVAEPVPSWGTLLRAIEHFHAVAANPWTLFPLALLLAAAACFHLVMPPGNQHV
jgi:ABC-type dipeptide/oligopeptide/nickel transport system permease subunit